MIGDAWTIVWREWRLYLAQVTDWRRTARSVLIMFLAFFAAEWLLSVSEVFEQSHPAVLIWIWAWLPLGSAVALGVDAFAGERERHTLETLLATRLSEGSILLGRIVAAASYAWASSIGFAAGVLVAINLAGLPSGEFFIYPSAVLAIAPAASLLIAVSGTSGAMLVSLRSPTVRHANTRILVIASIVPVVLTLAVLAIGFVAIGGFAVFVEVTGRQPVGMPEIDRRLGITLAVSAAALLYLAANITIWLVTRARFKRWAMLDLSDPRANWPGLQAALETAPAHDQPPLEPRGDSLDWFPAAEAQTGEEINHETSAPRVLRDAGIVAWKEWRELLAMFREWRGWFVVVALILAWMAFQMSATASRYWAESSNFSLVWWLAMAGALPLLISQRIADSVAGERERHTGEVLFTTRLTSQGILLGKLIGAVVPPLLIALGIPLIGLITVNLVEDGGPYRYPASVVATGAAFTLASATLMASAGTLISMRSPTIQDAARRMSWLVIPYALIPAFGLRRMAEQSDEGARTFTAALLTNPPDPLMNGDLLAPIQWLSAAMLLLAGLFLTLAIHQFRRGRLDLD